MINEHDKGGLQIIDIQNLNASLKIKWVQSYLITDNKGKWKSVFDYYLKKVCREIAVQGNLKRQDTPLLDITEPFFERNRRTLDHYKLQRKEPTRRF